MSVRAVIFDLFNTLVLLDHDESAYIACFRQLHDVLVQHQIDIPFEECLRVYIEERDQLRFLRERDLTS